MPSKTFTADHASLDVLPYRALLRRGTWEARKGMVMAVFSSGRAEGQAVLRQALQDPDERLRLLAAQALERLNETFQKSVQEYRRLIAKKPGDARLRIALARLLFDRAAWSGRGDAGIGAFEEAARHASAAIKGRLPAAELNAANALFGKILARLGRTAEARDALDRVPAPSPDYLRARLLWAETCLADGDIVSARNEMRRILTLNPPEDIADAARFWESPV